MLLHHPKVTEDAKNVLSVTLFLNKNTNDLEIAMLAAKYAPSVLAEASNEILANRAIMFIACCKSISLISHIDPSLANDRTFVKAVIQRNPYAIEGIEDVYHDDAEIRNIAIKGIIEDLKYEEGLTLYRTPTFILENEDFVNQATKISDDPAKLRQNIEYIISEL